MGYITTYVCDKCGKEISNYNKVYWVHLSTSLHGFRDGLSKQYELCGGCYQEILDPLKKKRK